MGYSDGVGVGCRMRRIVLLAGVSGILLGGVLSAVSLVYGQR